MAYIEPPRENRDGTFTYRVRWRKGGKREGKREGEPFRDLVEAENFRDAVTRAGDDWPWGYVPGVGWDHETYAALLGAEEPAPERESITFAAFAQDWANGRTKAAEATRNRYRDQIRLHIEPVFGSADISDEKAISEDTVNKWVISLLEGGDGRPALAPSYVHDLHAVLKAILKVAVRRKLRDTNPCEDTELPPHGAAQEDEMVFLTREQFHVLAAHLNPDVRDMVIVAVNTGLRWGELSALQVRDVQGMPGPKPYLRIRRAWKKTGDGSFKLGPPKSKRSRRNVSVNQSVALILVGLIANKKPTDFLFKTPTGKVWRHSYFYNARWRPAVYKAIRCEGHRKDDGLPASLRGLRAVQLVPCGCPGTLEVVPTIHSTRHSHAAWVIADGGHLTTLQRRLGHSSIKITSDRYGHLPPEIDDALVAALEVGWIRTLPAEEREKALAA
jgi:integrase